MTRLSRLRTAALPFVARSLRGARARRTAVLALVLAVLSVAAGLALARGAGPLERAARVGLDLEAPRGLQEFTGFALVADDDVTYELALREREALREFKALDDPRAERPRLPLFAPRIEQAGRLLVGASRTACIDHCAAIHGKLAERARREGPHLAGSCAHAARSFDWNDANHVAALTAVLDAEMIPNVVRYASPLDAAASIAVTGAVAALVLMLLLVVVGPVMVGITVASEVHENTLLPLSGTALRSREIALGLTAGALAPILLTALPLSVVTVGACIATGSVASTLVFFGLLLLSAWALSMLALVVGLHGGRKRGPGAIGIALLALLGSWAFVGVPLGLADVGRGELAAMTVLPSGAMIHALAEGLLAGLGHPRSHVIALRLPWHILAGAAAMLVVGALAMLAAERRVPGRFVPALRRVEALAGAAVLSGLTLLAAYDVAGWKALAASLGAVTMPFMVLLMARVPTGNAPAGRVVVPVGALLAEFGGWIAVHVGLAVWMLELDDLVLRPTALAYLGWALLVAALVALRVVAAAASTAATVFAGTAFVTAIAAFGMGIASLPRRYAFEPASVGVGWLAIELLCAVAIPALLLRPLRAARPPAPRG
ncbi:MAG: hypothetical protein IPK74_16950 [Deltaproteobacteria bacterium]|nr:hypothetical protein [Deltaproteobacteria bacterium]